MILTAASSEGADVRVDARSLVANDANDEQIRSAIKKREHNKKKLKRISLSRVEISPNLVDWFFSGEFPNLEEIWLNECRMKSLPSEGIQTSKIRSLEIKKTPIEDYEFLRSYKNLRELVLFGVGIDDVPEVICDLEKLNSLTIAMDGNIHFSQKFREAESLLELNLLHNKSLEFGLRNLPLSIEKLSLDGMGLEEIPKNMCQFGNLEELSLSRNRLDFSIIKELACLNLKVLDLSYNRISKISYVDFGLRHVEHFDISHNPINELPSELWNLKELKALVLIGTSIIPQNMSLPENIEKRKELEERLNIVLPDF